MSAPSAPYWGQLPGPKVTPSSIRARRLSDNHGPSDQRPEMESDARGQASKAHRASVQTTNTDAGTESTSSPFVSPIRSSFQGSGLAPRPPSMPYGASQFATEFDERRRRRQSRNREEEAERASAPTPPAAPDAPRAPPASYKSPSSNGAATSSGYGPAISSRTSKRSAPPADYLTMEPDDYYRDTSSYPVLDRSRKTFDGHSSSVSRRASGASGRDPRGKAPAGAPAASGGRSGHQRKTSTDSEIERRMFADDRSPLQRLELTLDSITKEEKRARLEAAENRIREREAREGGRHQTRDVGGQQAAPGPAPSQAQGSQQQVRFRDGGEDESEEKARQKAARERPVSLHAYKGPLSQNPPDEGRRYPSGPSSTAEGKRAAAAPAGSDLPKRNLSFRERAARTSDLRLPNGADAGPLVQDSPVTTPPAGVFQITRTGSNKLRKDPPGDLWQSKRKETEKKYPHAQVPRGNSLDEAQRPGEAPRVPQARGSAAVRTSVSVRAKPGPPVIHDASAETGPSTKTRGAPPRQPVYQDDGDDEEDSLEELEISVGARPPPRASASQRKPDKVLGPGALAAAAAGAGAEAAEGLSAGRKAPAAQTGPTRPHPPPQQAAEAPPALKGQAAGVHHRRRVEGDPDTSSDDRSERSESHHHRVSNLVYRAREKMQPGQGMYKPPKYLDEWKKGTVGTLSGALLDLTEDLSLPGPSAGVDKDKAWWEGAPLSKRRASLGSRPKRAEAFDGEYEETATRFKPALYLKCGPLLRFCGIKHERAAARQSASRSGTGPADREIWRGTIMIVTQDSDSDYTIAPTLRLFIQPLELLPPHPDVVEDELPPEYVDPIAGHPKIGRRGETLYVKPVDLLEEARDLSRIETEDGLFESTPSPITADPSGADAPGTFANRRKRIEVDGEKVGKYKDVRGFRLHAERGCTFWRFNVEVELRERQQRVAYRINRGPSMGFWVPAAGEAMNIMFYSCNGFSLSVNSNEFCGPDPMWRDVLNTHQSRPFHVMVGGGDQIYNDAAMVQTRLFREWLSIKNPLQKHNAPFTAEMQDELEAFYLERYAMWFSQGLFGLANSQIPMVNMFDDHDIIDGFGSYPHHFMNTPVFSGLGAVAFKYYMLFQHQSVVDELEANEPSWTLGVQPGPYINELSRSIFMSLGGRVALLAVDCRTERTRDEVVCEATWKKLMDRCYDEIVRGQLDHLLVLLGVPIAYPRLVWLENILTSRLLDPIKALGKTGLLGNFLNKFDGGVEVLDDLDDHWTAKNHKHERQIVIEDLQDLAADKSVRVTILSGDVHLAAVGQFYSNPKVVELPKHKDFRYIPNIISSAIVNTPPPDLMADVLNKRNKVHQFDEDTVEDMIPIFTHGVDGKPRNNKHLLPHRNWCAIRLYQPGDTPPSSRPPSMYDKSPLGSPPGSTRGPGSIVRRLTKRRGSSYRPDGPSPTVSRPPLSAGLDRMFSRSRRASTSSADQGPGIIKRTLSLTRADSLTGRRGLFGLRKGPGGSATNVQRPPSPHHDNRDGRVANNRDGYDDYDGYDDAVYDDYHDHPPRRSQGATAQASSGARDSGRMGLRGGAGSQEYVAGDDSHFTASRPPKNDRHYPPPAGVSRHQRSVSAGGSSTMTAGGNVGGKPLSRTPTGLSAKQIKRAGGDAAAFDVDVEGALEVTINVEVSPKDPAGITTPYRLVVPRLVYNYDLEEGAVWKKTKSHGGVKKLLGVGGGSTGGIKRWVSLRRGKSSTSQQEVGLDGEDGDDHHDHHGGEDYERADEQHRNQLDYDDDEEDYEHDARHRHHQGPAPGGGGVGSKAQNQHYLA